MVSYVRISELPPATEATGDSELEVNQAGVTRKITVDQIADVVAEILPPPVSDWDDITGKPDFDATYVNVAGDTMTGALAATTATFDQVSTRADVNRYALLAGRYSAGFGKVAMNTQGAYGWAFQVNGVSTLDIDSGAVAVSGALVGTTATMSDAIPPTSNDTTVPTTAWVKASAGTVNAKWYGATGDGVANDTAAIQAALNTGRAVFLPKGSYLVTDALTVPYGSGLFGETKYFSKLIVPATFNLAALGVIRLTAETTNWQNAQPGTIRDISIEFSQPDTAARASLVQYPPAIYAVNAPRIVIQNIRLVRAWNGIWMGGGSGGSTGGNMVDSIEASCFNKSIFMDDVLDVMHISRIHLWPFGCTTNQSTVMADGNTTGLEAGRVDALHITDFFAISMPKGIWLRTGTESLPNLSFGQLENIVLDDSGLVIANGTWTISNLFLAPGAVTARSLSVIPDSTYGAFVTVSSLFQRILTNHATPECIYVGSSAGTASLNVSAMTSLASLGIDRTHICCDSPGSFVTNLQISGAHFIRDANTSPTNATILFKSGRGALTNITASDKGTGTGDLIKINADNWIQLSNITNLSWTVTCPASPRYIASSTNAYIATYTPSIRAFSGTLTSYSASGRYTWNGKYLKLQLEVSITTNGTAAVALYATLPAGFLSATRQNIFGRETAATGAVVQGSTDVGGTEIALATASNAYPGANGYNLELNGEIEVQ